MKKSLSLIFAWVAWFSVIAQFYLMIENRIVSLNETIIRFFSYFTILTNALVAVYFTSQVTKNNILKKPGTITALTVYIFIVGFVYQLLLRPLWHPAGLQKFVDELLHSINPVLVIIYWVLYEDKKNVRYAQFLKWLIYPFVYLFYILLRGGFSGFYPYPFVNVLKIGMTQTLINSFFLLLLFSFVSITFIFVGRLKK